MNSVKIAYIVCATIGQIACLAMAILVQFYDVPAANWWTGFLIFIISCGSYAATERMNSWRDFGEV